MAFLLLLNTKPKYSTRVTACLLPPVETRQLDRAKDLAGKCIRSFGILSWVNIHKLIYISVCFRACVRARFMHEVSRRVFVCVRPVPEPLGSPPLSSPTYKDVVSCSVPSLAVPHFMESHRPLNINAAPVCVFLCVCLCLLLLSDSCHKTWDQQTMNAVCVVCVCVTAYVPWWI